MFHFHSFFLAILYNRVPVLLSYGICYCGLGALFRPARTTLSSILALPARCPRVGTKLRMGDYHTGPILTSRNTPLVEQLTIALARLPSSARALTMSNDWTNTRQLPTLAARGLETCDTGCRDGEARKGEGESRQGSKHATRMTSLLSSFRV